MQRTGQVWFGGAMGLLDDAIHEHLELKRLHGADPSEVIHEEREAFGFALRVEGPEPAEHMTHFEGLPTDRAGCAVDDLQGHSDTALSHLSQETVELDMRAVLEADSIEGNGRAELYAPPPAMSATPSRARAEPSTSGESSTGDSLEWEIPAERKHNYSGRPREKFAPVGGVLDAQKVQAGDVLAGRLDSLRATSSQERM
jgi:hypothetical protein